MTCSKIARTSSGYLEKLVQLSVVGRGLCNFNELQNWDVGARNRVTSTKHGQLTMTHRHGKDVWPTSAIPGLKSKWPENNIKPRYLLRCVSTRELGEGSISPPFTWSAWLVTWPGEISAERNWIYTFNGRALIILCTSETARTAVQCVHVGAIRLYDPSYSWRLHHCSSFGMLDEVKIKSLAWISIY